MNTPPASVSTETLHALLAQREWIERLARGLTRDATQAEDVAQESWIALMRRPPEHTGNLRSWLATLVRNTARKLARAESRRQRRELSVARDDAEHMPAQALERAELARTLLDAVLALDEPYRRVLIQAYVDGRALNEIARESGVPAATVRSQHSRGLELLRERLDRGRDGDRSRWFASVAALAMPRADVLGPGGVVGVLAMKWKLAAAAALVALLGFWIVSAVRDDGDGARAQPVASEAALETDGEPLTSAVPFERELANTTTAAALTAATTAALDIRVTWERDGTPAAHTGLHVVANDPFGRAERLRATTDGEGRARVDGLAPGKWGVYGVHGGSGLVEVVAGEERPFELVIRRGVHVRGRVVDGNGAPVAGAAISISASPLEAGVDIASSDAEGRFELRDVATARSLGARKSPFAPARKVDLRGAPNETLAVELVLSRTGGSVAGIVRDAAGAPVANARVTIGNEELRPPADVQPKFGIAREVLTASDGTFHADAINPGAQWIVARATGRVAGETRAEIRAGETARVEVLLPSGAALHGRVHSRGDALAGVTVYIASQGRAAQARTKTDATGAYAIPDLPEGEHEVRLDHPSFSDERTRVELHACADTRLDVDVDLGHTLVGRVVDSHDEPLAGVRVRPSAMDSSRCPDGEEEAFLNLVTRGRSVKTDANGYFLLARLPAIPVRLDVWPAALERTEPIGTFADVLPPARDLVLRVDTERTADAWIAGTLVDSAGQAACGVRVSARPDGDRHRDTGLVATLTDAVTGRFRVGPLRGGAYVLTSSAKDWLVDTRLRTHIVEPAQELELGELPVEIGGIVSVKVSRTGGAPLGSPSLVLRCITDGKFLERGLRLEYDRGASPPLPPGEYEFVTWAGAGYAPIGQPHVEVRAGEEVRVEIELPASTR